MSQDWITKTLGEIGEFTRGGNFTKSDFVEIGIPCIHYGQIHMHYGVTTEKTLSYLPKDFQKIKYAKKGDLIIAITSEDDEGSCKCTAWLGNENVAVGGHIAVYHHSLDPKFMSYYFRSPQFQKEKLAFTHGFKVVEIKPSDIAKIRISYPKFLSEQERIVALLDDQFAKIDALKANAASQLQAAKDLFQSALKEIFISGKDWKYLPFEECLVRVSKQKAVKSKEYLQEGLYPIVSQESDLISGYSNDESLIYKHEKPIVIFGDHTKNIKYIDFDFIVGADGVHILFVKDNILPKFFYYELCSIKLRNLGYARHYKLLKEKVIGFPSLPEQERIAARLDTISEKVKALQANYDQTLTLCNDLKQALLKSIFE